MDDSPTPANVLRRGIRSMDIVVILTTFVFMVLMLLVMRNLYYADVFILNLLQSIEIFISVKNWRRSGMSMFFGIVYLIATCKFSLHFAIPCTSCIVVSWIATCHNFGYPHVSWIFTPCLLIWGLKFIYNRAPDAVVVIAILKTGSSYLHKVDKSIEDLLLICAFIALHLTFAVERHIINCLLLSYGLSFIWMWLKTRQYRN